MCGNGMDLGRLPLPASPANHLAPPFFPPEHSASAQVEQSGRILLNAFMGEAALYVCC